MRIILVVDDDPASRELLARRLRRKGFEVLTAEDGSQAVELARSAKPDLILMDMSLPVKDGWKAAAELKTSKQTRHIPLIALTGHDSDEERERAHAAGCDAFESKPFSFPSLNSKIEKVLSVGD